MRSPLKILYVDHTPAAGGAQIVLLNLIRSLDRRRYLPLAASSDASQEMLTLLQQEVVEHAVIPFGQVNPRNPLALVNLLRSARALAHLIRAWQVDLIHSNTTRAHVVASLAAGLTGVPLVWTLHDNTFPIILFRLCCQVPKSVICVSRYVRDCYPLPPTKTRVIHNGVPISDYSIPQSATCTEPSRSICNSQPVLSPVEVSQTLRQELGLEPDAPLIINVGRLVWGKGAHIFAQAARQVLGDMPQARFVLVGGPDPLEATGQAPLYSRDLTQLIHDLNLDGRFLLVGHRQDVARFYAAADLCVYSAVSPEGLPTVLLEAMAHGKPIVASALGGAPELVQDGVTARLVPAGQADALATAIRELLRDRKLAQSMGEAGRARVEREFDLQVQAKKVLEVYDDILACSP